MREKYITKESVRGRCLKVDGSEKTMQRREVEVALFSLFDCGSIIHEWMDGWLSTNEYLPACYPALYSLPSLAIQSVLKYLPDDDLYALAVAVVNGYMSSRVKRLRNDYELMSENVHSRSRVNLCGIPNKDLYSPDGRLIYYPAESGFVLYMPQYLFCNHLSANNLCSNHNHNDIQWLTHRDIMYEFCQGEEIEIYDEIKYVFY